MRIRKHFLIMCVCLLFILSAVPVYAGTQESVEWYEMIEEDFSMPNQEQEVESIMPRTRYIVGVPTRIYLIESRKLGLRIDVACAGVVSSIGTTFYLEKKINGSWTVVSTGYASASNTNSMSKAMSVSGLATGTYRARTYTVVSHSGYTEGVTGYSGPITIS